MSKTYRDTSEKSQPKLGIIRRTLSYIDKEMYLILYKSLVRPHIEHGSNVWSVIYKKGAKQIENVQRRATRILPILRNLTYSKRLKHLGLPSLEYKRLRSDIIETYKIMNDIDCVDKNKVLPTRNSNTRGHHQKIYKKRSRINVRKYSFT